MAHLQGAVRSCGFSRGTAVAGALLAALALATSARAAEEVRLSHKYLSRTTSAFDAAVTTELGQLESTAIASINPANPSLVRLESAFTVSPEGWRTRLKLGDSTSDAGAWGSAVRFAGVHFSTGLDMRQDLLYAPRLALTGAAIVPTTADAMLAAASATAPGLSGRGLSAGRATPGAAGLALNAYDAAGRSTSLTRSLVAKPRLVDEGCNAYSFSLGRVRENYALEDTGYGALFANSTVLCGLGGGRALEAHGEFLAGDAALAGVSLSQQISTHGTATIAAAASDNLQGKGYALQLGLQREIEDFSFGLQARVQTPEYRDLGQGEVEDAIAQRMLASIARRFNDRAVLSLAYAMQRTYGLERADVLGVTQTLKFRSGGSVSIGAHHSMNDRSYSSFNVNFARALSY
jgi:outer membrane usher protein